MITAEEVREYIAPSADDLEYLSPANTSDVTDPKVVHALGLVKAADTLLSQAYDSLS